MLLVEDCYRIPKKFRPITFIRKTKQFSEKKNVTRKTNTFFGIQ